MNCNKIALGHHADDILETFPLNMMFNGTLKSMPPILKSDDDRNTVSAPLPTAAKRKLKSSLP